MHTYDDLIHELIRLGYLKTDRVIEAFKTVDRALFIPEEKKEYAYKNVPIQIAQNGFIVQPLIAAFVIELLDLRPGNAVLEIGTATGWQTAIMARLVEYIGGITEDEDGRYGITSCEPNEEIKNHACTILDSFGYVEKGVVRVIGDTGQKGDIDHAPFDKIVCWYGTLIAPGAWHEQLRIGGQMIVPTYSGIALYEKTDKNTFTHKEYFGYTTPHWHPE